MRKAFDVYFRRGAAWRSLKYGGLCRRTCSGLRRSTIQTRNSSCIISERVDRHFIAREMEEMRRVGFLSCVLVERESGRCVGVLDYRPGACVYLSLLMLDAALRGKGFGTACYGCLEETLRRQGASSVRIDVVEGYPGSAAPFWEKQGFVRTGRAKLAWDGCSAEAAVMVKQLACAGGQHAPSSVRR